MTFVVKKSPKFHSPHSVTELVSGRYSSLTATGLLVILAEPHYKSAISVDEQLATSKQPYFSLIV